MVTRTRLAPGQTAKKPPTPSFDKNEVGDKSKWHKGVTDTIDTLVTTPLMVLAAKDEAKNPDTISPYALDVATTNQYKQAIAGPIVELAASYPHVANLLNKLAQSTPIAALLAVGVAAGMQYAENHGVLPKAMRQAPGLILREDLAKQVQAETEAFQEEIERQRQEQRMTANGDTASN